MYRDMLELASFPALVCAREDPCTFESVGTVILFHGLAGEKEEQLDEVERFGNEGFIAIAVDAVGHGSRRTPEFEQRIVEDDDEAVFFQVIKETLFELPSLLDAIAEKGWLKNQRVAIFGVSMGAYIALASPLVDKRVAVVVSISGSPKWELEQEHSPERHTDAYWPVALLQLHGGEDEVVPVQPSAVLCESLKGYYGAAPDRLRRVVYPEVGHIFPEHTWTKVMDTSVRFCQRWLVDNSIQ